MAKFGGAALRVVTMLLYALAFACSAIILAIYSYFLAIQSQHNVAIASWEKAVEGMAGIGVVYTIFAVILTCCLGGFTFFAFLGIFLDILLVAAFIAIAVMTRDGRSCSGNFVDTPIGDGNPNSQRGNATRDYGIKLHTACRMNTVAFAVAIIGAFLFLISALFQLWLGRHHQREKKYGPSPQNNYTAGSGVRFFKRKRGNKTAHAAAAKDAEAGYIPPAGHTNGHTLANDDTYVGNKYEAAPHNAGIPTAGGYHTGPAGSSVNPYGYDNPAPVHKTAGTNF